MPKAHHTCLTDAELDVLRILADGRTNAEIARTLIVSTNTVKTHVAHILQKLDVKDRHHAGRVYRVLTEAAATDPGRVQPGSLAEPEILSRLEMNSPAEFERIYNTIITRSG